MSTDPCPKGHPSTEPDFCSDCGAKIQGVTDGVAVKPLPQGLPDAPSPMAAPPQTCPDCAAPHEWDSGDFCEICGYNFVTGAHGEVAIAPPPIPVAPLAAQPHQQDATEQSTTRQSAKAEPTATWHLTITLDTIPHHSDSPPAPEQAPITLTLKPGTHLIGRTSQARAIAPDVSLDVDDAISHRHAVLTLQPDGVLILRDIGSANGTSLNGIEIKPMTDAMLKPGDEITLGHWTRIKVMNTDDR